LEGHGDADRIVPDLAIEVLSDSTAKRDRTEKKEIYALNGVDEYWLVDTDAHEVMVLCRDGKALVTKASVRSGRISSRVLPDLELSIEDVFRGLP
jgi:Uma2 family endonuclease